MLSWCASPVTGSFTMSAGVWTSDAIRISIAVFHAPSRGTCDYSVTTACGSLGAVTVLGGAVFDSRRHLK
jgi:hypothetical protein